MARGPLDTLPQLGVGGIMVSIAAFQAVDPGSIPGRRMTFWNGPMPQNPAYTLCANQEGVACLGSAVGSASVS